MQPHDKASLAMMCCVFYIAEFTLLMFYLGCYHLCNWDSSLFFALFGFGTMPSIPYVSFTKWVDKLSLCFPPIIWNNLCLLLELCFCKSSVQSATAYVCVVCLWVVWGVEGGGFFRFFVLSTCILAGFQF